MFLDWLLKTEEGNVSYEELQMFTQDRCLDGVNEDVTCHMAEHCREIFDNIKLLNSSVKAVLLCEAEFLTVAQRTMDSRYVLSANAYDGL